MTRATVAPLLTVPRITRWSEEEYDNSLTSRTGAGGRPAGIAYPTELPSDRVNGVLVLRCTGKTAGVPLWSSPHPGRQHHLMLHLRCRVCGGSADRTDDGHLWLLPLPTTPGGRPLTLEASWPEGAAVEHPPVCAPHALSSPTHCRALDGALLVRARTATLWGFAGLKFLSDPSDPDGPGPVRGHFSTGDPDRPWVLATHLLRTLTGCTPLTEQELRAELASRGTPS
ncbi:hypothetical protein ACFXI0_27825 [Kitasatospora indigofera]|uniref:hypothetical protein n=1 Tax=Kitasatospora indigofera TaxID=67307 RepID=UPI00369C691A